MYFGLYYYKYRVTYIRRMLDKIKSSEFYKKSSHYLTTKWNAIMKQTSLGSGLLYVYSFVKNNYPKAVHKFNDVFMITLKTIVFYCMNDDYSKNKYVKYVYDKFNNDPEYIENIAYKPVLKMESTIINSKNIKDISMSKNDTNVFANRIMFQYDTPDHLIIFHKTMNDVQYHRIFSHLSWNLWKKSQDSIDKEYDRDESVYTRKVFEKFDLVSIPFIFIEIVYQDLNEEWKTIMIYDYIKKICVYGNSINHDSLQYLCMKYHNIDLNKLDYRLNVLFPKTESITEYDKSRLNSEPIILS